MAALTPDQFRADFPAFNDTVLFPDSSIQMWLDVSVNMFNVPRWGTLLNLGTELWVAHNLTLDARDQDTAYIGGLPGEMEGVVSSKSVDRVSVGYDTAAAMLERAGTYALTSFGLRYLQLARMIGAGGLQVS